MRQQSPHGFTLVELAIALMVIGLLIGGVLKGQELITNATNLKIARNMNDYKTAAMVFQSTYNGFPGDLKNAASRLPNCTAAPCTNNGIHSPGDNIINTITYFTIPAVPWFQQIHQIFSSEAENFWYQLIAAGLLSAQTPLAAGTYPSPLDSMFFAVHYYQTASPGDAIEPANYLIMSPYGLTAYGAVGLRASAAEYVDAKLDDGKPYSGDIRALGDYSYGPTGTLRPGCVAASSTVYNTASPLKECGLAMRLQ